MAPSCTNIHNHIEYNHIKIKSLFQILPHIRTVYRFMDFSFPRHFVPNMLWMIRSLDDSFRGRFVPWMFRSLDVSFHGRLRNNMDTIVFVSVIRRIYEVNLKTKYI